MTQIEEIERFVKPFYSKKDFMHDLYEKKEKFAKDFLEKLKKNL